MAQVYAGHHRMEAGQDAEPMLADAVADFDRVLSREPALPGALWGRGTARRYWAMARARRAQDPEADLQASEVDFGAALALDGAATDCWSGRGRTRSLRAFWRILRGDDPRADLVAARGDLERALRLQPNRRDAPDWLGELETRWALWRGGRGEPVADELARADKAFGMLERAGLVDHWMRLHRSLLAVARAFAVGDRAPLGLAHADLDASWDFLQKVPEGLHGRGLVHAAEAILASPGPARRRALAAAEAQFARALERDPRFAPSGLERDALRARLGAGPPPAEGLRSLLP